MILSKNNAKNRELAFDINEDVLDIENAEVDDPTNVFQELSDSDRDVDVKQNIQQLNDSIASTDIADIADVDEVSTSDHENLSKQDGKCEDTIFGEFITAMLLKMDPDKKRRIKKEIINVLL